MRLSRNYSFADNLCFDFANIISCALPRDCCFGVKTDFIDRLKCHPFGWHLYNIVS